MSTHFSHRTTQLRHTKPKDDAPPQLPNILYIKELPPPENIEGFSQVTSKFYVRGLIHNHLPNTPKDKRNFW